MRARNSLLDLLAASAAFFARRLSSATRSYSSFADASLHIALVDLFEHCVETINQLADLISRGLLDPERIVLAARHPLHGVNARRSIGADMSRWSCDQTNQATRAHTSVATIAAQPTQRSCCLRRSRLACTSTKPSTFAIGQHRTHQRNRGKTVDRIFCLPARGRALNQACGPLAAGGHSHGAS